MLSHDPSDMNPSSSFPESNPPSVSGNAQDSRQNANPVAVPLILPGSNGQMQSSFALVNPQVLLEAALNAFSSGNLSGVQPTTLSEFLGVLSSRGHIAHTPSPLPFRLQPESFGITRGQQVAGERPASYPNGNLSSAESGVGSVSHHPPYSYVPPHSEPDFHQFSIPERTADDILYRQQAPQEHTPASDLAPAGSNMMYSHTEPRPVPESDFDREAHHRSLFYSSAQMPLDTSSQAGLNPPTNYFPSIPPSVSQHSGFSDTLGQANIPGHAPSLERRDSYSSVTTSPAVEFPSMDFRSRSLQSPSEVGQSVSLQAASSSKPEESEKRRSNTTASARFRAKKKLREQELEKTAKEMQEKVEVLETHLKNMSREVRWLRGLLVERDGKDAVEASYRQNGLRFAEGQELYQPDDSNQT